jgi:hypothetical protein
MEPFFPFKKDKIGQKFSLASICGCGSQEGNRNGRLHATSGSSAPTHALPAASQPQALRTLPRPSYDTRHAESHLQRADAARYWSRTRSPETTEVVDVERSVESSSLQQYPTPGICCLEVEDRVRQLARLGAQPHETSTQIGCGPRLRTNFSVNFVSGENTHFYSNYSYPNHLG